jgi:hypothetical protein
MPDARLLTPEARRAANRLLEVLQRERTARGDAASDRFVLALSRTNNQAALIDRATGALMMHYGLDSLQALAVLVGWARESHTSVSTIAHTLLRGICEGNPQTEARQRALLRWLEAQLRADSEAGS